MSYLHQHLPFSSILGHLNTFCFTWERPVDFRYEIAPPRLIDYSGEMILTVGK